MTGLNLSDCFCEQLATENIIDTDWYVFVAISVIPSMGLLIFLLTEMAKLIERLQSDISKEQLRFDQLKDQLSQANQSANAVTEMTSELLVTQTQLSKLCSRNMQCLAQQQQQRLPYGDSSSSSDSDPSSSVSRANDPFVSYPRRSLSSRYREANRSQTDSLSQPSRDSSAVFVSDSSTSLTSTVNSDPPNWHPSESEYTNGGHSSGNQFQSALGEVLANEINHIADHISSVPLAPPLPLHSANHLSSRNRPLVFGDFDSESSKAVSRKPTQKLASRSNSLSDYLNKPQDSRSLLFDELKKRVPKAPAFDEEGNNASPKSSLPAEAYSQQTVPSIQSTESVEQISSVSETVELVEVDNHPQLEPHHSSLNNTISSNSNDDSISDTNIETDNVVVMHSAPSRRLQSFSGSIMPSLSPSFALGSPRVEPFHEAKERMERILATLKRKASLSTSPPSSPVGTESSAESSTSSSRSASARRRSSCTSPEPSPVNTDYNSSVHSQRERSSSTSFSCTDERRNATDSTSRGAVSPDHLGFSKPSNQHKISFDDHCDVYEHSESAENLPNQCDHSKRLDFSKRPTKSILKTSTLHNALHQQPHYTAAITLQRQEKLSDDDENVKHNGDIENAGRAAHLAFQSTKVFLLSHDESHCLRQYPSETVPNQINQDQLQTVARIVDSADSDRQRSPPTPISPVNEQLNSGLTQESPRIKEVQFRPEKTELPECNNNNNDTADLILDTRQPLICFSPTRRNTFTNPLRSGRLIRQDTPYYSDTEPNDTQQRRMSNEMQKPIERIVEERRVDAIPPLFLPITAWSQPIERQPETDGSSPEKPQNGFRNALAEEPETLNLSSEKQQQETASCIPVTKPDPESSILPESAAGPHSPSFMTPNNRLNLSDFQTTLPDLGDLPRSTSEDASCHSWDPTPMINKLYKVDYTPVREERKESYVNVDGHLDHLPIGMKTTSIAKAWRNHYFKTQEGRLIWFEADKPVGNIVLANAQIDKVDADDEEQVLIIHGGRDGALLVLRPPSDFIDNWRHALVSHSACCSEDNYVRPVYPPVRQKAAPVAIIELGSCSVRAGLLTVEPSLPSVYFPCVAAELMDGSIVVGTDALKPSVRHKGVLIRPITPTQPAINRYMMDLKIVKHIFAKVFEELRVNPVDYSVLLSLPQNAPALLTADLLRLLLHDFGCKGVSISKQPTLVLYSYDVTTGVVVDLGDRLNIVPVVDGYVVQNGIVSLPDGGYRVADELRCKLAECNNGLYAFLSTVEKYILRYITEQVCYVADDFDDDSRQYEITSGAAVNKIVSLADFNPTPDMQKEFKVGSARFSSTEGLMKPKRWGLDVAGLQKQIFNSVQASPMDSRRTLYKNIYLSGGASMLPGLVARTKSELSKLVASSIQIQVHASPWRLHAAFIGAQVLAGTAHFEDTLVDQIGLSAFLKQLNACAF